MTDNRGPYSRLYHRFPDEFPNIYADDRALSAWCRLLIAADAAWPLKPAVPRSIRPKVMALLQGAGLIVVSGDYYTVRGLDAERARRSSQARRAAEGRWHPDPDDDDPTGNAVRNAPRIPPGIAPGNAETMPSRDIDEKSKDEKSTESARANGIDARLEGLPHLTDDVRHAIETLTGRTLLTAGEKQLTELDRLVEDHGSEKVVDALHAVRQSMTDRPTARQLVWTAVKRLEPFPSASDVGRAESEAEAERARAHREELARRHLDELRAQPATPAAPFSALVPRPGTQEAPR